MSGQGGRRRHFRPSQTWPRAGSAHEQLSMEITRSGEGERCRGKSAAGVAVSCECGTPQGSRGGRTGRADRQGGFVFTSVFGVWQLLGTKPLFWSRGLCPFLYLPPALWAGRAHPRPYALPGRGAPGPQRPSLPPRWSNWDLRRAPLAGPDLVAGSGARASRGSASRAPLACRACRGTPHFEARSGPLNSFGT